MYGTQHEYDEHFYMVDEALGEYDQSEAEQEKDWEQIKAAQAVREAVAEAEAWSEEMCCFDHCNCPEGFHTDF